MDIFKIAALFEQASILQAKNDLRKLIGKPRWLKGIGIGGSEDKPVIAVNVESKTSEVMDTIPKTFFGFDVVVTPVGNIYAQASKEEEEDVYGYCPVCHNPGIMRCRCKLAETTCKNGHQWHFNGAEVHLGTFNHDNASDHSRCFS